MSNIDINTAYKEAVNVPIEEAISYLEVANKNTDGVEIPVFEGKDSLGISTSSIQEISSNIKKAKNILASNRGELSAYLDGFDNAEVSIEECLKETTGSNYSLIELTLFELHNARSQSKDTSAEMVYDPSYPDYYNYVFNKLDKKLRKDAEKILKTNSNGKRIDPDNFVKYYQTIFPYCGITYGKEDITVSENACGLTCGAMVLSNLFKKVITPNDIRNSVGEKYIFKSKLPQKKGWGTDIAVLTDKKLYEDLEIDQKAIRVEGIYTEPENLADILKDGNSVIVLGIDGKREDKRVEEGKERLFTSIGHYVLITGMDEHGNFIVVDPNGFNSFGKSYDERHFTPEEIGSIAAGYTVCTYIGK